jgi:hypothetical protein
VGTGRPIEINAEDNRPGEFAGCHPRLFNCCEQTLRVRFVREGGNVLGRVHPHECLLQANRNNNSRLIISFFMVILRHFGRKGRVAHSW